MTRSNAREVAVHMIYELGFGSRSAEELLEHEMTRERFAQLGEEEPLYAQFPNEKQRQYIRDLVQGVYATILGTLFALLLEWKGNLFASVFLHIGANVWSLVVSDVMLYLLEHVGAAAVMALNLFLVFAGAFGIWKCYRDYKKRGCTRKI